MPANREFGVREPSWADSDSDSAWGGSVVGCWASRLRCLVRWISYRMGRWQLFGLGYFYSGSLCYLTWWLVINVLHVAPYAVYQVCIFCKLRVACHGKDYFYQQPFQPASDEQLLRAANFWPCSEQGTTLLSFQTIYKWRLPKVLSAQAWEGLCLARQFVYAVCDDLRGPITKPGRIAATVWRHVKTCLAISSF
jgi:hypothetical protein